MSPELAKGVAVARQLVNHFTPVRLGIPILQGFLLGCVLMFLKLTFEPFLRRSLSHVVDIGAASDALWFLVGIAIVIFLNVLLGRPLVSDMKREQIGILEIVVSRGDLSGEERRHIFRTIAWHYARELNLTEEVGKEKFKSIINESIESVEDT